METIKQINIKNRRYYFYNDIINLDEFDESKIKKIKKTLMISIFIILALKISECHVTNSVNPLYLRIITMNGQFEKGKDDAWYLVISDKDDVYKKLVHIFFFFFFYLGFLSRTFTNHRTAGEGGGHFFNSSLPLPPASQTIRH